MLAFPIAIPPSYSNSFFKPSTRPNHCALFFGSRTANPKCPTTPTVNGTFMRKTSRLTNNLRVGNRIRRAFGDETSTRELLSIFKSVRC